MKGARRKTMNTKISKVYPNSIAEEVDIEVGDTLISINDTSVKDIIDYKFLLADEYIEIEIEKPDGEIWSIEIEKEYDESLGIEFENQIMDDAKSCCNKCLFCFIDQLPKGMRKSLYFKDDDSRLSFLQGNFVTLTNMKDEDIDRIIRYRISPINISVHTTNPELRVKMLNNRFAGNICDRLKKLSEAGISMNCQIVSCPGINNGEELIKTVEDLYKFHPSVENVAVVPVGITKYREGLSKLELYSKENAKAELDNIKNLQYKYSKEIGQPFVRLSDEFYITAGEEIPEKDFYGDYEQLEDGIGMIRIFRDSIDNSLNTLGKNLKGSFTLVTGASAYNEIHRAAEKITNINNKINLTVKKIINHYFGETITVAGLITGKDIIEQLSAGDINEYIIIPKNMLKSGEDIFLDDITLDILEKELNRKVIVCDYTGEDLIKIINDYSKEE
jgi:putative radical SAM enzyme (TIGR03279 family)